MIVKVIWKGKIKMKKMKKFFTIAILMGLFGSQTVYAFITEAKTYNVKSNEIVEIHTGGGRLTQTKTRENRGTCWIATGNQTMWTNPSGRLNNSISPTAWVNLPNGDGVKSSINKTTGRTYTLQLKGSPLQTDVDSLDAKIDTEW